MFHHLNIALTQRQHFADTRSWMLSLYNRVLLRHGTALLPGRRHLSSVQVRDGREPMVARLGTTDWLVIDEIFIRGEYERVVSTCPAAGTILDLGANVGLSVRFWADAYPQARIVAVEPDPENFAVCLANAHGIPGPSRTTCVQACVSTAPGHLHLDRSGGEWAFRSSEVPGANSVKVRAVTIPELMRENGLPEIDLLKCDIEGAEAALFADCSAWIQKIRCLVVETHKPYGPEALLRDIAAGGGRFEVISLTKNSSVSVLVLKNTSVH